MATTAQQRIARRAIDERMESARVAAASLAVPRGGWVRAIRDALGLTSADLGRRLGLEASTVRRLEGNERDGVIGLDTLMRAANALDCDLIYGLIPRRPLDDVLMDRALRQASAELARVDHTMGLEGQSTGVDASRTRHLARELVDAGLVNWDE